jgi:hypothetical protein
VCHLVFLLFFLLHHHHLLLLLLCFSTYAFEFQILCSSDLDNGASENSRSKARWKYKAWTCEIRFQIFARNFRWCTKGWEILHVNSMFKIIKMTLARKVSRSSLWIINYTKNME